MSIVEGSEQEYIDLDLSPIRKKRIRINGDNDRVLELDTTDMGVISRLNEIYPKLAELEKEYGSLDVTFTEEGTMTEESFAELGKAVSDIDKKMRDCIDEIFNSNVSDVCAPTGSMFDPINGSFRFEYIIDALSTLYSDEIAKNMQKRKENIGKHTAKYKGKSKGKKEEQ